MKKILDIHTLAEKIAELKKTKKTIIHCHGVFDVLHFGHIQHFNSAKSKGNILVVTLTPDQFVNKGPNRPIFNLENRMKCIAALNTVDFVAANHTKDAVSAIKILKPNIYCKGKDYIKNELDITGQIKREKEAVKKIGGVIYYTKDELFSSSNIINKIGFNLTNKQKKFLAKIKKENKNEEKIKKIFDSFSKLKVLVIGETIIDEYVYTEALGKSGKEPILVLKDLYSEKYLGGAAAISKNLYSFCKKTKLLSCIGEKKEYEKFIMKNLPKKVEQKFIYKKNSPTILKKRYVDSVNRSKILGVHSINDYPLEFKQKKQFSKLIEKELKNYDLVVVSDYGHGLISSDLAKILLKKSKFLAVNSQLNAANTGYHTISKYVGADLIIINENEMRFELRNKIDHIDNLIKLLSKKLRSKYTAVTSGNQGSKMYVKKTNKIYHCPPFASSIKDKVGTGDTMLSLLAISIYSKINIELAMLLSSLGAAENIKFMANSVSINKEGLMKSVNSYLK